MNFRSFKLMTEMKPNIADMRAPPAVQCTKDANGRTETRDKTKQNLGSHD